LGAECATEIIDWCNSNNGLLAGTIHPSIAGGFVAAFPLESNREGDNWLAAWGVKSEDSVYIAYTYAQKMLSLLLLYRDFPFDGIRGNIKYDNSDELHRHVRIGRDILSTLILSLWNAGYDAEHFPRNGTKRKFP
jgi:hypothetical protein